MMLEESGAVVAVQGEYAWVETQAKSACSQCHAGDSCGTSALGKWFARKRNRVQVLNHLGLKEGDGAVVGIRSERLIRAALLAYMLPLIFMIAAAGTTSGLGAADAAVAASALMGLMLGMVSIKLVASHKGKEAVSLLRGTTREHHVTVNSNFIERG